MAEPDPSLISRGRFPGGSDGKASVCSAGDPGSIPGLGRSPGEGNDPQVGWCVSFPLPLLGYLCEFTVHFLFTRVQSRRLAKGEETPQAQAFKPCVCAQLCLTLWGPWTVARQVPLPMEFLRQEYSSAVPFPPPGDLPDPRIEPGLSCVSCIGRGTLYHSPPGKPIWIIRTAKVYLAFLYATFKNCVYLPRASSKSAFCKAWSEDPWKFPRLSEILPDPPLHNYMSLWGKIFFTCFNQTTYAAYGLQKQVQRYSCLLRNQILREICIIKTMPPLLTIFGKYTFSFKIHFNVNM